MSFTINQTGIETYDEVTQLLFPHPPIIEERFQESGVSRIVHWSIPNTACVVEYSGTQARRYLKMFVRTLTATQMATLVTLRDTSGLFNVKPKPGDATTYLCTFAPDEAQDWRPMVADHPEAQADGSAITDILKVYEAHIVMVLME